MRTIPAEQFKKQFGEDTYNQFGQTTPKQPGLLSEFKSRLLGTGQDISAEFEKGVSGEQSKTRSATGVVAKAFSTPFGLAKDVLPEFAEKGLEKTGEGLGKGLQWIAEKTTPQFLTDFVTKHPDAAKMLEEGAGTVSNVGQIAGDILAIQGGVNMASKAGSMAKKGLVNIDSKIQAGVKTGEQLAGQAKAVFAPKPPAPVEAVKQVLQGKTKDLSSGVKALKEINTQGVQKYGQLATKIDDTIKSLSEKVDKVLDNKVPVKLNALKLTGKTTAGKNVSVDYISRGLNHLKEMYSAVGDDISVKNISELIKKATTKGLTRKEVNDIARTYGMEFGEKAFGKTGEALTSVNAKMFENTRKALKIVARQGMKGTEAEKIDKSISSLYKVKGLVSKNVEAVNKLAQKVQERGLAEKIGYNVAKYADILTGGSIRGIVGGLLPRGVGYKVMNALDLEKALERNLKIITEALDAGDEELIKILKPQGGIPKTTDLIQEARKYKSAEEFVKAQTNFNHASAGEIKQFTNDYSNQPVFLTKDANYYKEHIGSDAKNTPVKVDLGKTITLDAPTIKKILNTSDDLRVEQFNNAQTRTRQQVFNWLKANGYDSATIPKDWHRGNEFRESTVVFNPAKQIQTKSQLTDLYNQAIKRVKKK